MTEEQFHRTDIQLVREAQGVLMSIPGHGGATHAARSHYKTVDPAPLTLAERHEMEMFLLTGLSLLLAILVILAALGEVCAWLDDKAKDIWG